MKLIKPSFQIITPINGENILKEIELAARTCYKSEGKIVVDEIEEERSDLIFTRYCQTSARTLIKKLIERGHEAMLEFGGMITVKFICDRGVSHELVRHRHCSFGQESTRFCNYGKDEHIQFIIPSWSDLEEKTWNRLQLESNVGNTHPIYIWMWNMSNAEKDYNNLIQLNWSPQRARSVLPNSLKTEINVSTNIRDWRHIFQLRTAKVAHPQMRQLMCPLLDEFKRQIPVLFDDINY